MEKVTWDYVLKDNIIRILPFDFQDQIGELIKYPVGQAPLAMLPEIIDSNTFTVPFKLSSNGGVEVYVAKLNFIDDGVKMIISHNNSIVFEYQNDEIFSLVNWTHDMIRGAVLILKRHYESMYLS